MREHRCTGIIHGNKLQAQAGAHPVRLRSHSAAFERRIDVLSGSGGIIIITRINRSSGAPWRATSVPAKRDGGAGEQRDKRSPDNESLVKNPQSGHVISRGGRQRPRCGRDGERIRWKPGPRSAAPLSSARNRSFSTIPIGTSRVARNGRHGTDRSGGTRCPARRAKGGAQRTPEETRGKKSAARRAS